MYHINISAHYPSLLSPHALLPVSGTRDALWKFTDTVKNGWSQYNSIQKKNDILNILLDENVFVSNRETLKRLFCNTVMIGCSSSLPIQYKSLITRVWHLEKIDPGNITVSGWSDLIRDYLYKGPNIFLYTLLSLHKQFSYL